MKYTKTTKLNVTADEAWKVFAHDFEKGDEWMSSVYKATGISEGTKLEGAKTIGRIVEMQPDGSGMKASETFVAYNEVAKTCSVRVDMIGAPAIFPIDHNSLDFSIVDDDADDDGGGSGGGSTATWIFGADLKPLGYLLYPLLYVGMSAAWSQMAEEFQYFVDHQGSPHPRKVAALEKASSAN